ncbi:uncharacterized protein LOC111885883 [Lactuca sativa]|uniref:uncharacterized protein LOC111885883 n=1 Tax=Lactuca sativa TaxID=4236 RepID=UPI0022AE7DA2|nr:uncharacterized protein LOC111885883 [Lactuca sativa]
MGESPDTMDDYMRMSERTARESLYTLSRGVVETFGDVYLRKPSLHDLQELYAAHEERHGFPGMIGSIDCTHWKWKNCPVAWKGQYASGHHGSPTLVLEAVASQDLWIWHAFFGVAGSNNDVNVLDQSPIFDDLLNGKAPDAPFTVNGNEYKYGYYLTDGIYPQYSTFVKAFRHPVEERDKFLREDKKEHWLRWQVCGGGNSGEHDGGRGHRCGGGGGAVVLLVGGEGVGNDGGVEDGSGGDGGVVGVVRWCWWWRIRIEVVD